MDHSDGLQTIDLAISYDTSRLDVLSVTAGTLTGATGVDADGKPLAFTTFLVNLDSAAGLIRIVGYRLWGPLEGLGSGSLVKINFQVKDDAPPGAAAVNLLQNAGTTTTLVGGANAQNQFFYYDLEPRPSNAPGSPLDGSIVVMPPNEDNSSTDTVAASVTPVVPVINAGSAAPNEISTSPPNLDGSSTDTVAASAVPAVPVTNAVSVAPNEVSTSPTTQPAVSQVSTEAPAVPVVNTVSAAPNEISTSPTTQPAVSQVRTDVPSVTTLVHNGLALAAPAGVVNLDGPVSVIEVSAGTQPRLSAGQLSSDVSSISSMAHTGLTLRVLSSPGVNDTTSTPSGVYTVSALRLLLSTVTVSFNTPGSVDSGTFPGLRNGTPADNFQEPVPVFDSRALTVLAAKEAVILRSLVSQIWQNLDLFEAHLSDAVDQAPNSDGIGGTGDDWMDFFSQYLPSTEDGIVANPDDYGVRDFDD